MKKTLLALAAAATLAVGFASTANAHPYFGFGFGFHPHYWAPPAPVVTVGYPGPACGYAVVNDWHWNAWHTFKEFGPRRVWVCN